MKWTWANTPDINPNCGGLWCSLLEYDAMSTFLRKVKHPVWMYERWSNLHRDSHDDLKSLATDPKCSSQERDQLFVINCVISVALMFLWHLWSCFVVTTYAFCSQQLVLSDWSLNFWKSFAKQKGPDTSLSEQAIGYWICIHAAQSLNFFFTWKGLDNFCSRCEVKIYRSQLETSSTPKDLFSVKVYSWIGRFKVNECKNRPFIIGHVR
jgi:hypothetical protein